MINDISKELLLPWYLQQEAYKVIKVLWDVLDKTMLTALKISRLLFPTSKIHIIIIIFLILFYF